MSADAKFLYSPSRLRIFALDTVLATTGTAEIRNYLNTEHLARNITLALDHSNDLIFHHGNKHAWPDPGVLLPYRSQLRDLPYSKFIADIRGARVRDLEEKRINKEMANIRKKFKGES